MTAGETTLSKEAKRPGIPCWPSTRRKGFGRPQCLLRQADWDALIPRVERWVDIICIGILLFSIIYLSPLCLLIFLR